MNEEGVELEVRLFGIDAPELMQPYGQAAQSHLIRILNPRSYLVLVDTDIYGRYVGIIHNQIGEPSINLRMVEAGYAHEVDRYGELPSAKFAQKHAQLNSLGMWQYGIQSVELPYLYRRRQRYAKRPRQQTSRPYRSYRSGYGKPVKRQRQTSKQDSEDSDLLVDFFNGGGCYLVFILLGILFVILAAILGC